VQAYGSVCAVGAREGQGSAEGARRLGAAPGPCGRLVGVGPRQSTSVDPAGVHGASHRDPSGDGPEGESLPGIVGCSRGTGERSRGGRSWPLSHDSPRTGQGGSFGPQPGPFSWLTSPSFLGFLAGRPEKGDTEGSSFCRARCWPSLGKSTRAGLRGLPWLSRRPGKNVACLGNSGEPVSPLAHRSFSCKGVPEGGPPRLAGLKGEGMPSDTCRHPQQRNASFDQTPARPLPAKRELPFPLFFRGTPPRRAGSAGTPGTGWRAFI